MFSISMDIFYPSAGTVFSKEGVFQQPRDITTAIRVQHRLGEAENSYTLTMAPLGRIVVDTMRETSSWPDQFSLSWALFSYQV
jgi:hypothetical protein